MKVQEYLEMCTLARKQNGKNLPEDFQYSCFEDFVLTNGKFMGRRSPLSNKFPKGKMKECFLNAYHLSQSEEGLTYCEGYAMGIIPVLHAWCINQKGQVIDNTWITGEEYFGVEFTREFVIKTALKRKYFGIIDDWQNRWPLLRGEKYA